MEYVHQKCLKRWLKHSGRHKCQVCLYRYQYAFETQSYEEIADRMRKKQLDLSVMMYWRVFNLVVFASLSYIYWQYSDSLILIDLKGGTTKHHGSQNYNASS